eukprot:gene6230-8585_t
MVLLINNKPTLILFSLSFLTLIIRHETFHNTLPLIQNSYYLSAVLEKSRFSNPAILFSLDNDKLININDNIDGNQNLLVKTQRRKRYSGLFPRQFNEKYKEIRGDLEVIEKVVEKGGTPAGQHIPIMLKECKEKLGLNHIIELYQNKTVDNNLDNYPIFVDCTVGYGGHSKVIIDSILPVN